MAKPVQHAPEAIDEIARRSLLFDFYGQLLTRRQQEVWELYTQENLSLGEIAEEFGISRQSVHDAVRNAQRALEGYEEKLGLVQRFLRTEAAIGQIDTKILGLIQALEAGKTGQLTTASLIRQLQTIKSIIDKLEE